MEPQIAPQASSEKQPEAQVAVIAESQRAQEAKPSEPFSQGFNEGIKTIGELKKDVQDQRSLLVVGTAILLVMVGTIIVMVMLSWMDTVGSLQRQVDQLELNQVNAAKINSTK
jgi:hypothetical protein